MIYLIEGSSGYYPEDYMHWNVGYFTDREKAVNFIKKLNTLVKERNFIELEKIDAMSKCQDDLYYAVDIIIDLEENLT